MEVLSTLYIIPLMSILILVLPLSNLRGVRKVKNMIPIVIISGLLLIGFNILGLYVVGLYPWLVILGVITVMVILGEVILPVLGSIVRDVVVRQFKRLKAIMVLLLFSQC